MNTIEVGFPIEGNGNICPLDRHDGTLWLFLTLRKPPSTLEQPLSNIPEELAHSSSLPVSAESLEQSVQADTETKFSASIPGLSFHGTETAQSAQNRKGLTGFEIHIRRSLSVIFISVTSMAMMGALSIATVVMVLRIVSGGRHIANFHVPMAVSLIFGSRLFATFSRGFLRLVRQATQLPLYGQK